MKIKNLDRITDFSRKHPNAEKPLKRWVDIARSADWANILEVRLTWKKARAVRMPSEAMATIFDIGGTSFRLITKMKYKANSIYIEKVLTHQEYDKSEWQKGL